MGTTVAKLLIEVLGDTSDADRKLKGTLGSLDSFGRAAQEIGGKLTAYVTAPLLAVGAASVKTAADFDQNMAVLRVTSGATGAEMEQLRQKAQQLGADLSLPGTSAADAADAMLELSKAGLSVNDTLNASRGVLQLSAAGQLSNAAAAETTANALNAFGLAGSEATRVADLLAASANSSSADVADMADALKMSAAVAASAGVPIEDVTTALAEMANAGIKGSDAGTSFKQMLLSLQAPTDKAASLMDDLGISIYDAQGNMLPMPQIIDQFNGALSGLTQEERNAALATIFGSDAVRAANIVLMDGVGAFTSMKAAVTEEGAAAELAAAQMEGLNGAFENIKSAAETAMLAGVQPFKQDIEDMARRIADAVNAFSELDQGTQKTIVSLGLLAAGTGPALMGLGAMVRTGVSLVNTFNTVAPVVTTVFQAFASSSQYASATSKLVTAFGAMPVALGATAAAVASVVAVWIAWNEQIVRTQQEGQKAVSGTWAKFFSDQAESGRSATQVAESFIAAQARVNDTVQAGGVIAELFVDDQAMMADGYNKLASALQQTSSGYSDYQAAAMRVAQANGLTIAQNGDLVQSMTVRGVETNKLIQANFLLSESQYQALSTMQMMGDAANDVGVAVADMSGHTGRATDAVSGMSAALETAAAVTMSASDMLAILDASLSEAGWDAEAARLASQNLSVALGETSAEAASLDSDVRLLAEAFSQGVIGSSELNTYLLQAKDGTLQLSEAQRSALASASEHAQALRDSAQAAQDAAMRQLELAQSLKDATAAQIAQSAIEGLRKAFEDGTLPFPDYITAVSGVQEAFGLSDEKSRALAEGLTGITTALTEGKLPASEFATALGDIIKASESGDISAILQQFEKAPAAIDPAKASLSLTREEMKLLAAEAGTTITGIETAFSGPDWAGLGEGMTKPVIDGLSEIEEKEGGAEKALGNFQRGLGYTMTVAEQFRGKIEQVANLINGLPDSKVVELITKISTQGSMEALSATDKTVKLTINVVTTGTEQALGALDELLDKKKSAAPVGGSSDLPRLPGAVSFGAAPQGGSVTATPAPVNIYISANVQSDLDVYEMARTLADEIRRNRL